MAKEPSKDEQIGIHKGSLSTLAKERQELARMLGIVEQLMHMHIEELKKLGVDLEAAAKDAVKKTKKKGSMEDRL
jgi:2-hydroxy-3-keto-5-methylthiopentenyl-1-phosphate phosphatase